MYKKTRNIVARVIGLLCIISLIAIFVPEPIDAAGVCGTGLWQSGNLEVHHINIGQGDATLIVGPTGKSLLFDAGESYWNSSADAHTIGPYIQQVLGCKSLDYVVISHFHVDHIGYVGYGGLWNLVENQGFTVGATIVRNYNTHFGDTSGTFTNWKTYLEGTGQAKLHPIFAVEGSGQVDLGAGVLFNIVAANGNGALIAGDFHSDSNPPSENDYSLGAVLSYGNFDEWIGGDLDGQYETSGYGYTYHDIELSVAPEVGDVDVYRANHHGSSHSTSATFINELDPEVSIISVGDGNTYGHPTQSIMDRLLATSTVYMTERGDLNTNIGSAIVAGNIVIKTADGAAYTVNGISYTAIEPSRIDVDGDGYFVEVDPNDSNSGAIPAPNGGCDAIYQTCSDTSALCQVTAGQVLINEVLPAPSSNGTEWVELYNATTSTVDIGHCYVDDSVGGSAAYQIPASTMIPAHGFWTLDRNSYFNNTGDDARLLKEDGNTVLDSYSFGSTDYDVSRYRLPDGGSWAGSPTSFTTKGQTNTLPFYPVVLSIARADENDTSANSIKYTVTFSKAVTGVNIAGASNDFVLSTSGITGASIAALSGSGTTYSVTVNSGFGVGTIRLDVADDDSIKDTANHSLGGTGIGNGSFNGEIYSVVRPKNLITKIGVAPTWEYFLVSGESIRESYASMNNGPVKVSSTSGVSIISSQRVVFGGKSYSEMMGLPLEQLSKEYWFPYYNNVAMDSQLRVSNLGNVPTTIDVYLGTQKIDSYTLAGGGATRKNYAGKNAGPLKVTSSATNILTTIRVLFGGNSYSEMMGLPKEQLSQQYLFPYYNNVAMDSQLRVSNLGNVPTTITVYLGTQPIDSYSLGAGGAVRKNYTGKNAGPLKVTSSATNILSTIRVLFGGNSYSEMMGLPIHQLAQEYWYPVYDNASLDSQLRVSNVGGGATTITVYAGSTQIDSYSLNAGAATRKNYPQNTGPLHVVSSTEPILSTIRMLYSTPGYASYYEMMGLPDTQLSTQYFFPWYNNVAMSSELRFAVP